MSDLVSHLLEAIQSKEAKARAAARRVGSDWRAGDGLVHVHWGPVVAVGGNSSGHMPKEVSGFIADNDPSSVLRRCEADRRQVERLAGMVELGEEYYDNPTVWDLVQDTLKDFADAYGITEEEK